MVFFLGTSSVAILGISSVASLPFHCPLSAPCQLHGVRQPVGPTSQDGCFSGNQKKFFSGNLRGNSGNQLRRIVPLPLPCVRSLSGKSRFIEGQRVWVLGFGVYDLGFPPLECVTGISSGETAGRADSLWQTAFGRGVLQIRKGGCARTKYPVKAFLPRGHA
jgi:hypothetical protein